MTACRAHGSASAALLAVGLALALSAVGGSRAEPCGEGVPRHALHPYTQKTCPMAGRMGSLRLAVPQQYLFAEVGYKGIDVWRPETHHLTPALATFDNELSHFTIRVRRKNFSPIASPADARDESDFMHHQTVTPLARRWMWVSFAYRGKAGPSPSHAAPVPAPDTSGLLANVLDFNDRYEQQALGKFTLQKERPWGLAYYLTPRSPGPNQKQKALYVDSDTHQAFIRCTNLLQAVPPFAPFANCDYSFKIADAHSHDVVDVSISLLLQDKVDLSDWKTIEQGLRALFASFIVP